MPDRIFVPSEHVVSREIEGEIIIVPLVAGIGADDEELFTLNETGRAIWQKLDGKKRLGAVISELAAEYRVKPNRTGRRQASVGVIHRDVVGLVNELLKRRMLSEVNKPKQ